MKTILNENNLIILKEYYLSLLFSIISRINIQQLPKRKLDFSRMETKIAIYFNEAQEVIKTSRILVTLIRGKSLPLFI